MSKSKILPAFAFDAAGSLIALVIGIAVIPLYLIYVTKYEYGIWLSVSALAGMLGVLDVGADQYLTTIAANDKEFSKRSISSIIYSVILIKLAISLIFISVGIVLYIFLNSILNLDNLSLKKANIIFILLLFNIIISLIFGSISTVIYARKNYNFISLVGISGGILANLITLILLYCNIGLISFPLSILMSNILVNIIYCYRFIKDYNHINIRYVSHDEIKWKKIINFSVSFQILRWVHTLRTQYVILAINNLLGPIYSTSYTLTNKLPQLSPMIITKFGMPFFPTISSMLSAGRTREAKVLFSKLNKLVFRISIFSTTILIFYNKSFVKLWVGADSYTGRNVEILLIIYSLIYSSMCLFGAVVFATKDFEKWTWISIVELIFAVLVSYFLSFGYGLLGVVMGFLVGALINQIYLYLLALKKLSISGSKFILMVLGHGIFSNIPGVALATLFAIFEQEITWIGMFIQILSIFFINIFIYDYIIYSKLNLSKLKNLYIRYI